MASSTPFGAKVCVRVSVLNQISMRNGGSGLKDAAGQGDSFICLFFISRPQSTGTDSPHSSWHQDNVRWYIVSPAEPTQSRGTQANWRERKTVWLGVKTGIKNERRSMLVGLVGAHAHGRACECFHFFQVLTKFNKIDKTKCSLEEGRS